MKLSGVDLALSKLDEQRKASEAPVELGEKPKRKIGESVYTDELAELICDRLAMGESLNRICKEPNMPAESTVRLWEKTDYMGFAAKYARARDIGIDHRVDRIVELAADESIPPDSRRIQVDVEKWYASKIAPKRYGDRLEAHVDHAVTIKVVKLDALPGDGAKLIEGKVESDDEG